MTRPLPGPPGARLDRTKIHTKRSGPSLSTKRPVGKVHFRNRSTGPKGLHPVQEKVTRTQSRQSTNQHKTVNVKQAEALAAKNPQSKTAKVATSVKMRNSHALHPYVKRLATVPHNETGPWALPDLLSAYNFPKGT